MTSILVLSTRLCDVSLNRLVRKAALLAAATTVMAFSLPQREAAAQGLVVSENGQPAYTHAISVPPGIAGMEPKMAVTHSPGTNGPLGYGWALNGLSTISRCPNIRSLDGSSHVVDLTVNDKLQNLPER